MSDRTLGDLTARIVTAANGMSVKNPNRRLLAECLAVIKFLGDELVQAKRAQHVVDIAPMGEGVAGDSADSGTVAVRREEFAATASPDQGVGRGLEANTDVEPGYGPGV